MAAVIIGAVIATAGIAFGLAWSLIAWNGLAVLGWGVALLLAIVMLRKMA